LSDLSAFIYIKWDKKYKFNYDCAKTTYHSVNMTKHR